MNNPNHDPDNDDDTNYATIQPQSLQIAITGPLPPGPPLTTPVVQRGRFHQSLLFPLPGLP